MVSLATVVVFHMDVSKIQEIFKINEYMYSKIVEDLAGP